MRKFLQDHQHQQQQKDELSSVRRSKYTLYVYWGHFLFCFIRCFLLTQTFGYREINEQVLGKRFNYVVTPEFYYTQVLVGIFNVTFCISILSFCSGTDGSYSLYSTHLTRSEFCIPARGIAYTNITHNVILCKSRCFPRVKIIYFYDHCTFVR